jgi:hypothetical protein
MSKPKFDIDKPQTWPRWRLDALGKRVGKIVAGKKSGKTAKEEG